MGSAVSKKTFDAHKREVVPKTEFNELRSSTVPKTEFNELKRNTVPKTEFEKQKEEIEKQKEEMEKLKKGNHELNLKILEMDDTSTFFRKKMKELGQLARDSVIDINDVLGSQNVKDFISVKEISPNECLGRILLFGPTGCGKTYITNALAKKVNIKILLVNPSSITATTTAHSTDLLKGTFVEAKKIAPCVLCIEELDTLFTGEVDRSKNFASELQLLMDALETDYKGVLFLGTTNFPNAIPEACRRRFDLMYYFPLPTPRQREQYLRTRLQPMKPDFTEEDFMSFVRATNRFCYADLKLVVFEFIPQKVKMIITNTTHFRRIIDPETHQETQKFTPCESTDPNAQPIDKIAQKNNIVVTLTRDMVMWAIRQKRPQTTDARVAEYERFSDEFGIPAEDED